MIEGGLALNDIEFRLVQATCPTSSVGQLMTLFLSLGARREGERRGVREARSGPTGRAEGDWNSAVSLESKGVLEGL